MLSYSYNKAVCVEGSLCSADHALCSECEDADKSTNRSSIKIDFDAPAKPGRDIERH